MKKALNRLMAKKAELNGKRSGFTMVELLLVILIGGILIVAGVQGYNKIYIPTQADGEVKKASMVIGGVERVKNTFNNGAYAQSAQTAIPNIQALVDSMGGARATNDVATWTYSCAAGANSQINIVTEVYSSPEKLRLIVGQINSQLSPWTALDNGDQTITISRPNSVCN